MMATKSCKRSVQNNISRKLFAKKLSKCVSLCKIIDAVAHSDLKGKQQLQSANWSTIGTNNVK